MCTRYKQYTCRVLQERSRIIYRSALVPTTVSLEWPSPLSSSWCCSSIRPRCVSVVTRAVTCDAAGRCRPAPPPAASPFPPPGAGLYTPDFASSDGNVRPHPRHAGLPEGRRTGRHARLCGQRRPNAKHRHAHSDRDTHRELGGQEQGFHFLIGWKEERGEDGSNERRFEHRERQRVEGRVQDADVGREV